VERAPVPIPIATADIELGPFLKLCGSARSGGEAKYLVQQGAVRVNGQPELHRHRALVPGDRVEIPGRGLFVVVTAP